MMNRPDPTTARTTLKRIRDHETQRNDELGEIANRRWEVLRRTPSLLAEPFPAPTSDQAFIPQPESASSEGRLAAMASGLANPPPPFNWASVPRSQFPMTTLEVARAYPSRFPGLAPPGMPSSSTQISALPASRHTASRASLTTAPSASQAATTGTPSVPGSTTAPRTTAFFAPLAAAVAAASSSSARPEQTILQGRSALRHRLELSQYQRQQHWLAGAFYVYNRRRSLVLLRELSPKGAESKKRGKKTGWEKKNPDIVLVLFLPLPPIYPLNQVRLPQCHFWLFSIVNNRHFDIPRFYLGIGCSCSPLLQNPAWVCLGGTIVVGGALAGWLAGQLALEEDPGQIEQPIAVFDFGQQPAERWSRHTRGIRTCPWVRPGHRRDKWDSTLCPCGWELMARQNRSCLGVPGQSQPALGPVPATAGTNGTAPVVSAVWSSWLVKLSLSRRGFRHFRQSNLCRFSFCHLFSPFGQFVMDV
ncbi:hypothetical protein GGS20DRAFT_594658 [Poronia punctata]|nr:hypothetical protein GGS20DRAFT_594658 [Poronia punctata]